MASEMLVTAGISIFKALLRNLMFKFIFRLNTPENEITGLNGYQVWQNISVYWRHSCSLFVGVFLSMDNEC